MKAPRIRRSAYFALGLAMAAVVWELDRIVPAQASMSAFYLVPIGFAAWFCGDGWGYAMSLLCAAAWLQGDMTAGPVRTHWLISFWNAMGHLGIFILLTVLAELIHRLRRLNDLERETSALKSDLVSLVSHEFANSLTTFKLSLTILKETDGDEDSAQRQLCYATLQRVYTHLSGSVANFLNLNRIEAGRFVPHLQRTHLRTLIHATVSQMGPLIEEVKVELRLDFPSSSVSVNADPDALSVIMSNLIGNAFKYTLAGGKVTARIAVDDASGTALVSVEDTGIGIAKSDRRMISSGYYRAENGRRVAMGFGVGLKVTRELLASLGADLEIESEPGRGSKFSFRLPLWSEKQAPAGNQNADD
jgi:signal transduction histidine kinase